MRQCETTCDWVTTGWMRRASTRLRGEGDDGTRGGREGMTKVFSDASVGHRLRVVQLASVEISQDFFLGYMALESALGTLRRAFCNETDLS